MLQIILLEFLPALLLYLSVCVGSASAIMINSIDTTSLIFIKLAINIYHGRPAHLEMF
jgi:hypothetical protein